MSTVQLVAIKHVEDLTKIGSRPLGSKKNQASADYVQNVFKASGLEVERQEFPCPVWENLETRLGFDGQRYVVAANMFSPACHVVASAVPVGNLVELEQAELAGRIALLYGDLTGGYGYSARRGYYFPERDRRVYEILEQKRPAALITIQPQTGSLQRLMSDWEFSIPSATVPAEVGLLLRRRNDDRIELKIDSHTIPAHFCNVSATKKGERQEKIVIFGDYDVDGATASALLCRYLRHCELDPIVHIPDRIFEGYGPNVDAIRSFTERGVSLLITVDCGTTSLEALAEAKKLGLSTLVIDHHQADVELPAAAAIVNPNRADDLSGLGHLAAVGGEGVGQHIVGVERLGVDQRISAFNRYRHEERIAGGCLLQAEGGRSQAAGVCAGQGQRRGLGLARTSSARPGSETRLA